MRSPRLHVGGSTATTEAVLMAERLTGRQRVIVSAFSHPEFDVPGRKRCPRIKERPSCSRRKIEPALAGFQPRW